MINRVFTSLIEVTSSWRGDVVKFAGDAMLVLFYDDEGGAVDDDEDEEDGSLCGRRRCARAAAPSSLYQPSRTPIGSATATAKRCTCMAATHGATVLPTAARPRRLHSLSLSFSGPPVDAHRDHERSRVQHGRRRSLLTVGDRRVRRADHATRAGDFRREARRVRPLPDAWDLVAAHCQASSLRATLDSAQQVTFSSAEEMPPGRAAPLDILPSRQSDEDARVLPDVLSARPGPQGHMAWTRRAALGHHNLLQPQGHPMSPSTTRSRKCTR